MMSKNFFALTRKKILWFAILLVVSFLLILFYRSPLYFNLEHEIFLRPWLIFLVFPIGVIISILAIPFALDFSYWGITIPLAWLIVSQIIYVYFLACLIDFIRGHIKKKKTKMFLKSCIKIAIIAILVIITVFFLVVHITMANERAFVIAIRQNNTEACAKLSGDYKYLCYSNIEEKNLTPSICEDVDEDSRRITCYQLVAYNSLNAAICENIEDEYIKYRLDCFNTIAINTKNLLLCDKLPTEKLSKYFPTKNECYNAINKK